MNDIWQKFLATFANLRDEEDGAESSEVILVIVILVIALGGAWMFLRKKISGAATSAGNCIAGASDTGATSC